MNFSIINFGFMSFDAQFAIIEIMVILIFTFVFGMFIFAGVKSFGEWKKNNNSPRLTVLATIVSKRIDVSHHHHNSSGTGMDYTTESTSYYITFQVESGDRMEMHVTGDEYGMLIEGDYGKLSFQGTRFLGFERSL